MGFRKGSSGCVGAWVCVCVLREKQRDREQAGNGQVLSEKEGSPFPRNTKKWTVRPTISIQNPVLNSTS